MHNIQNPSHQYAVCMALGVSRESYMCHSEDNNVLQTDGEKEGKKQRQLLQEVKRAKGSLQERGAPGGFAL